MIPMSSPGSTVGVQATVPGVGLGVWAKASAGTNRAKTTKAVSPAKQKGPHPRWGAEVERLHRASPILCGAIPACAGHSGCAASERIGAVCGPSASFPGRLSA